MTSVLHQGVAIESHAPSDDGLLQFDEGDVILVLSDTLEVGVCVTHLLWCFNKNQFHISSRVRRDFYFFTWGPGVHPHALVFITCLYFSCTPVHLHFLFRVTGQVNVTLIYSHSRGNEVWQQQKFQMSQFKYHYKTS